MVEKGNGKKEEGEAKKRCPVTKEWCWGEACAWMETFRRQHRGGLIQESRMCTFIASNVLLSEINTKLTLRQEESAPVIQLPGNLRGRG